MDSFFESLHSYNIISLWHIQLKERSMEILCTVYKIRGIYLYETESYWNKNTCTAYEVRSKKQPRQRSKYLGPKEKAETKKLRKALGQLVSKSYGNTCTVYEVRGIYLLEEISKSIGLYDVLKECYPDIYREILANSFYVCLCTVQV